MVVYDFVVRESVIYVGSGFVFWEFGFLYEDDGWFDVCGLNKFQYAWQARTNVSCIPCNNMGICGGGFMSFWLWYLC